jgi:lysophospholipase L1-like esterase
MNIGVWGDSITHGSCDSEALGWVGRIRKALPSDDYNHIYNFGICGDTSDDLINRFDVELAAIHPEKVIFAVGINDSKFPEGSDTHLVSLETYEQNLWQLIEKTRVHTDVITIVGATKVDNEWRSARGSRFMNEEIAKFNEVMKKVADENNLDYIDVFETLDPATDLADGLHPNAQGYDKMFEVIKANLDWI